MEVNKAAANGLRREKSVAEPPLLTRCAEEPGQQEDGYEEGEERDG